MPTQEEKVAHVEASLRGRFFQYVPRNESPQRAQWTDVNHDTDRLTRALAAYAIVSIAGVDDAAASSAVTDDENDAGIDSIYYDRSNNRLIIVQSKFKRTGTAPSQDENLKTINGVRILIQRRFQELNANFHRQLDEIEAALDTPGVTLEVVLTYLGINLGPHVTDDLNGLQAELDAVAPRMNWQSFGIDQVYDSLIAEQAATKVTIERLGLENWAFIDAPRRALYGQVRAATLAQLVEDHGKSLFERNPRHYLGSVGVNAAIEETTSRRPEDLFYLNNGLTAVVETITPAVGTQVQCNFRLVDFSIVNGAQTAGAIASAAMAGAISPDAKVLITLIELGANRDDIGLQITRARNHQNTVRGIDFAALDPTQERLRQEIALLGITYHYRHSAEASTRREDAFKLEEAALALACMSFPVLTEQDVQQQRNRGRQTRNAIDYVVSAKKEVGKLWNLESSIYHTLFTPELPGLKLCRLVKVYRFIDSILAGTEAAERDTYQRSMFFRHGRYYIMAFVAQRSGDVLGRLDHHLSTDDETLLSRRINEISELIYQESIPYQVNRGYLSVFRNLTDSQPLADRVLARLAAQDQAAEQAIQD